ncbi:unnamed protein product [Mycena citricolor]|uniref:Carboxypeptidase n=1 Tax=Mycena citricolor TaxID=2018698 RepID=A0AAD2Q3H5_9AGAR|nr:unnamed protein product [Mycena citricolor]
MHFSSSFLLVALTGARAAFLGSQTAFPPAVEQYDEGLFTPMNSLSSLSSDGFTTLSSHPAFPAVSVRIKKSTFCDGSAAAYTGYIDVEARHLFFYFFESRSDPDTDDVIFWTNGGPGCSSSLGLFMELGPCRILDENGPKYHPDSWNTNANIFFIDQPVGVGYSYAEYGESVSTTEEAAKDIAAFVFVFFEHFSQFKGRGFHMAGESYAGRYIPVFAAEVYDQNAKLIEAGLTPINLKSVMIGNGLTDMYHQISSSFEMQCTSASVPPVSSIGDCVRMKQMVRDLINFISYLEHIQIPRCEERLRKSCVDRFDPIDCESAAEFCNDHIGSSFWNLNLNPYDISMSCSPEEMSESLCYAVTKHISNFLSAPSTRDALGVSPLVPMNFSSCSNTVNMAFTTQLDMLHPTQHYIAGLLERGVRVLIYVGTYDWICNWVGNERWTNAMEWSGQDEFAAQALRPWAVKGTNATAGMVRNAKGLTFLTVDAAGHMVPYDKPKESLDMLQRWLAEEKF